MAWMMDVFGTGAAGLVLAMAAVGAAQAAEPKAYVVNEITVTDPATFQTYAAQVPATLAPFGGRYIVRSGATESLAGPPPGRVVILEFPSRAQALAWRNSEAYQKILPIREATSTSRVYVIDGVAP